MSTATDAAHVHVSGDGTETRCWGTHGHSDGVTLTREEIDASPRGIMMSGGRVGGPGRHTKGGLYGDVNDYFGKDRDEGEVTS